VFSLLSKPTLQDPQLGELRFGRGRWTSASLPTARGNVVVEVDGTKENPEPGALDLAHNVFVDIEKFALESIAFVNAKPHHPHAPDFSSPVLEALRVHAADRFEIHFSLPNYGEAIVFFENNEPCNYSLRD
jgi:hypothetical protein